MDTRKEARKEGREEENTLGKMEENTLGKKEGREEYSREENKGQEQKRKQQ